MNFVRVFIEGIVCGKLLLQHLQITPVTLQLEGTKFEEK